MKDGITAMHFIVAVLDNPLYCLETIVLTCEMQGCEAAAFVGIVHACPVQRHGLLSLLQVALTTSFQQTLLMNVNARHACALQRGNVLGVAQRDRVVCFYNMAVGRETKRLCLSMMAEAIGVFAAKILRM